MLKRHRTFHLLFPLLVVSFLLIAGVRGANGQCYTFSSGTAASLTVNITHLPAPTATSVSWIYQYSSDSGLLGTASLTVGQTTYTPISSPPISMDLTVADDPSSSYSGLDISLGFVSPNDIFPAAAVSLYWTGNFFPNGSLPATLPPFSGASDPIMSVSVIGPNGTIVDQTYALTSIASCSGGPASTSTGIFRNGLWILDYNGNGQWDGPSIDRVIGLGQTGDIAVVGDWNGDGRTKVGVFRNGVWVLDYNGNGQWDGPFSDRVITLGQLGDIPVAGDWNGDGRSKVGIFRSGIWVLDFNGNGQWDGPSTDRVIALGGAGDVPITGDWNGDGRSKVGIFRSGVWVLDFNGNGQWDGPSTDRVITLGQAGDISVTGDWNGDGRTKAGIFRNGVWVLDYNGNGQWDGPATDRVIALGQSGDTPVAGRWATPGIGQQRSAPETATALADRSPGVPSTFSACTLTLATGQDRLQSACVQKVASESARQIGEALESPGIRSSALETENALRDLLLSPALQKELGRVQNHLRELETGMEWERERERLNRDLEALPGSGRIR